MGGWRKRTCAGKGLASNTGFVPGPAAGRASALDSGRRASALPGKFGFRTFWHNLALMLPVRAELRTVCRGYRSTDFFADFLAALVVALAAPDVRTSHTLGIRL